MCFLVLSYAQDPRLRLLLATNRDEFYERPTAQAEFWKKDPNILAGRDLRGGGTWLGITRTGRFAALTNFRDPLNQKPDAPTRGNLVSDYLRGSQHPQAYLEDLLSKADRFNGFNLILGDAATLWYFSNYEGNIRALAPGLYGLSNHLLDTPWPKVERGKVGLQDVLQQETLDREAIFTMLADDQEANPDELPDTGIGPSWEKVLSSIFIKSPVYGTRASTVVTMDYEGRVTFEERTHTLDTVGTSSRVFSFETRP